MAEPFLAEVKIVGFNFAPRGWAFCDGQLLPINQYQALFSLLGTVYGGNGRQTFGLPDLRGRTPISPGSDGGARFNQGHKGGEETHTLLPQEVPSHTHKAIASNSPGDKNLPTDNVLAKAETPLYGKPDKLTALANTTIKNAGGGQSHDNMAPFLAVNFCIALQGLFPSRN